MIEYKVSIREASAHLIDVWLEIDTPSPDGQVLSLPNWIPGSYMIRDFSRNIVQIEARSEETAVALVKRDKSTWQAPAGLASLTIHYRIYAWDLSVRAAHVDRTHAFFNGTSVFLAVRNQEESPHRVTFVRPQHDTDSTFELATSMPAVETDDAGFGIYQASSYNELIDHPVEQGAFKRLRFEASGVPHEIVLTGTCHFDEARLIDDLTCICEYQIDFFGQPAPMDRYVFLVMVVGEGYGGLEHRASTALMITRENLPVVGEKEISEAYLNFLGLCSHEYFHTWNVKRIKPARFVPFDLSAESYTELLWFFEGVTSYYDDLILVRAGLIDEKQYLSVLAKTLTRVQRGPGRLIQSVTESSFDAWHKFYKQDENSPNAIVSYYAKGALVALCLDAQLRKSSAGCQTLDTLMRVMWARWLETGRGVAEDEPQRLAASMVDADLSEFFELALYSTEQLPVIEALRDMGVYLRWRPRASISDMGGVSTGDNGALKVEDQLKNSTVNREGVKPWLGAALDEVPGGMRIVQVISGSPAEQAGLAGGDVLIAMNHLSVSKDDVDRHLLRYADTEALDIHFFRLGQLHLSRLPIEPAPADTAELQITDGSRLAEWLLDKRIAT